MSESVRTKGEGIPLLGYREVPFILIDNEKVEEGLVIQEMQSGYTMHDRLLRPSMVGVSKKPTKDMKDEKKN